MSQSGGVLLSSLGQGLVQFAGVYGDTKTSSLEAEGQRLKEMRLQEMQANRNTLTDAFRIAEYDSSQERLAIAKNVEARAQATADKKSYIWKEVPKYGWVEETVTEYDPYIQDNVEKIKKNWEKVGSHWMGINKDDPKDRVVIRADGSYLSGDEASRILKSDTPVSDPKITIVSFADYEAAYAKTDSEYTGTAEEKKKLRRMGEARGITFKDSAPAAVASTAVAATATMTSPGAEAYPSGVSVTTPPPSDTAFWEKELASSDSPLAISSDPAFVVGEKIGAGAKTAATVITDALTGNANLDSSLRLAAVNDLVKNWASDGLNDNEIRAKLEEKSEDKELTKDQRSAFKEVLKGFTVAPRSHPQTDISVVPGGGVIDEAVLDAAAQASNPATIRAEFGVGSDVAGGPSPVTSAFGTNASGMEESSAQLATQEQTIPMGKRFRNPGGSAISVPSMASSQVAPQQSTPSPVTSAFGTNASGMEDASASPLSVSGISVPQTDPATSETLGFPNPTGPTERGEIELSIESWNGVVPQALASLMPEEMVNFLIKYPSLEVAVKAGAVGAWNQVVEWVRLRISGEQWRSPQQDAQSLEIVGEGVGEARGEVVPTLPEIVGEGVGEARGEVVPTLPPARTFDPSDGMGMNASLANAGSFPATGGIISSPSTPPTEENLRNLEILESLKKQGSFGNKVEPEVVNLAPVGQIASQPSTSPDTSSKADAKKQVLEIVAAMEQANIGKEVIRKELLRLLGIIKPADYNSSYARALAEVYFEFTKESN